MMPPEVRVEFNPHVRGVAPDTWAEARIWALRHNHNMGWVVTEALREFLEQQRTEESQRSGADAQS
jgi:hypothetical protein